MKLEVDLEVVKGRKPYLKSGMVRSFKILEA
jgi:hypothetical protein